MNRTHRRSDNSGCHPTVDLSVGMASITENTDHPTPTPALPGRVIDLRPMFEQSARTARWPGSSHRSRNCHAWPPMPPDQFAIDTEPFDVNPGDLVAGIDSPVERIAFDGRAWTLTGQTGITLARIPIGCTIAVIPACLIALAADRERVVPSRMKGGTGA